MDQAARVMAGKGVRHHLRFADGRQHDAVAQHIKARLAEKYPDIELIAERPTATSKQKEAFAETNTILNKFPDVKLIMAICSPAVPTATEGRLVSRPRRT